MLQDSMTHKYWVNTLRSTNQQVQLAKGFPILVEVSHLRPTDVDMLYSLIEIWLRKNCRSVWTLEEIQESKPSDRKERTYIRLVFQDPREAVFYKLSPSYLHNRPMIPYFLSCLPAIC